MLHFMDWRTRVRILEGTALGLAYLHEGYIHGSCIATFKASNILQDKDLNPEIADFGFASSWRMTPTQAPGFAGTAGHVAPEYAMRGLLTEKAGVFSFGIAAFELVSGRPNLDFRLENHAASLLNWV